MDKEITEKVLTHAKEKHKGLSDLILCLTIFDVRRIIENTVRETRRHIASQLDEYREKTLQEIENSS